MGSASCWSSEHPLNVDSGARFRSPGRRRILLLASPPPERFATCASPGVALSSESSLLESTNWNRVEAALMAYLRCPVLVKLYAAETVRAHEALTLTVVLPGYRNRSSLTIVRDGHVRSRGEDSERRRIRRLRRLTGRVLESDTGKAWTGAISGGEGEGVCRHSVQNAIRVLEELEGLVPSVGECGDDLQVLHTVHNIRSGDLEGEPRCGENGRRGRRKNEESSAKGCAEHGVGRERWWWMRVQLERGEPRGLKTTTAKFLCIVL